MNERTSWAAIALAAAITAGPPAQAAADSVMGDWLTATGSAKIRIAPCAGSPAQACGTVIWLKEPRNDDGTQVHDGNNPNPALRARPVLGIQMISDFHRESPGHWVDGRIYDANSGKTYRSKMSAEPDGKLRVSGCVLMFCQAQTWTRAN